MIGDTIAAVSTPAGEGGIGIVRVSGEDALEIVDAVFRASDRKPLREAATHTIRHGFILDDDRPVDEVLVTVMRAPRTYTREDVVEVNCHGGVLATQLVLERILRAGARIADRGEFTRRAFVNGRLSLDEAKSVADVVRARSADGLEAAVRQLAGRFSEEIAVLRARIAELRARIELGIDFPEDDTANPVTAKDLEALIEATRRLCERGARGRVLREGLTVAIVGRPNVGKSTLLNALLAERRAIVTSLPGTTRDTVEDEAVFGGIPVRLIDTAGLRETRDAIEAEGVARAEAAIARSDLVLLLLDRSGPLTEEDRLLLARPWDRPVILVWTKADLPRRASEEAPGPWLATCTVSALEGTGIDVLREEAVGRLYAGEIPQRGTALLLERWEMDQLRRVEDALARANHVIASKGTADMVADELRQAHVEAGHLLGMDVDDEVLDEIFSRFCVGK
ncbi:MAG: tRNA uridine-5-carboxymethylaminomethyl(34) synthesis GTPase MnmE [Candidatus Bipolaricaulota bacterium]|nr:MAG: tRNA uridine-5-carboxymethylaminomethyl(34) synthesis GTPase MnmE [Candidatus Bipolaricaulota bacterium]